MSFPHADVLSIPLPSLTATEELTKDANRRISKRSRYCDSVWDLSEETGKTQNSSIHWEHPVSNGSSLLDHPEILEPIREYIERLLLGTANTARTLKISTINVNAADLKRFAKAMIDNGAECFDQILPSDIRIYLKSRESLVRFSDVFTTIRRFLEFALQGSRNLPSLMQCFDWEMPVPARKPKQTEIIPDEVLKPLFDIAQEYVLELAPFIIEAKRRLDRAERQWRKDPVKNHNPKGHRAGEIPELNQLFAYSTKPQHLESFGKLMKGLERPLPKHVKGFEISRLSQLRDEIYTLQTACFVLLGLVSGMRISELLSIKEDALCKVQLPDILEPAIAVKGIWLKGSLSDKGTRTQWICGPLGEQVVKVLLSLTDSNRKLVGTEKLFVAIGKSWDPRRRTGEIRPNSGYSSIWGNRLNNFLVKRFDLRDAKGDLWRLKSHQFRRTFSRMIARWTDCPLTSLQFHLKHLDGHMTQYYTQADDILLGLWADERREWQIEVLGEGLSSPFMAGGGGQKMAESIRQLVKGGHLPKDFWTERTGKHARKLAEQLLDAGGVKIKAHTTNWCIDLGGEDSKCNPGGAPLESSELCRPTCCSKARIFPKHRLYWELIVKESAEAVRDFKNQPILKKIAQEQLADARKVLAELSPENPDEHTHVANK